MVNPKSLENLRNGGTNRGGSGTVPSELRYRSRELYERFLDKLEGIADDPDGKLSSGEVSKVVDVMGKYGLGEKKWDLSESAQVQAIGEFTAKFFQEHGTPELFEQWVQGCQAYVSSL